MAIDTATPRSRQLYEAGFKNFGDAMACLDALVADRGARHHARRERD
jgi:hypothetical protein